MIVPAGFPNDTFPILASSGERVSITPAGKAAAAATTINIYGGITLNNVKDSQSLLAELQALAG